MPFVVLEEKSMAEITGKPYEWLGDPEDRKLVEEQRKQSNKK